MVYKYNLDGEFSSASSFDMSTLGSSSGLYTGPPFSKQWIMNAGVSGGFMELNGSGICVGPQVFFPVSLATLPSSYCNALTNVTGNLYWQSGAAWFPLTSGGAIVSIDEKVRASLTDLVPGFLDAKVDNATIEVSSNALKVKDNVFLGLNTFQTFTGNEFAYVSGVAVESFFIGMLNSIWISGFLTSRAQIKEQYFNGNWYAGFGYSGWVIGANNPAIIQDVSGDTTVISEHHLDFYATEVDIINGPLNMNDNKITNLGTGETALDAVNKAQLDTKANLSAFQVLSGQYLNTSGYVDLHDAFPQYSANLNMSGNKICNVGNPIDSTDAVNLYTLQQSLSNIYNYFFTDEDSAIVEGGNTYKLMSGYYQALPLVEYSYSSLSVGDTFLKGFITKEGEPGATVLPRGLRNIHIHAKKTSGTQETKLYATITKRVAAGTETLLLTTTISEALTATDTEYDLSNYLNEVTVLATDRFVIKIYARVVAGGSAPDVTIAILNNTSSSISTPTINAALASFVTISSFQIFTGIESGHYQQYTGTSGFINTFYSGYKNTSGYVDTIVSNLPYGTAWSGVSNISPSKGVIYELCSMYTGAAKYTNIRDAIDQFNSSGRLSGGQITWNSDSGAAYTDLEGFIKTDDYQNATGVFFHIPSGQVALTDNSINYLYVDYNAGTPIVSVTTDRSTVKRTNQFTLGTAYREGTEIEVLNVGTTLRNFQRAETERLLARGIGERMNGLVIGEVATRKVSLSAGVVYVGLTEVIISALTGDINFDHYYYRSGVSTFSVLSATNQINNTQYNRLSDYSLQTLTANRYGVHWIYMCAEGNLNVIMGVGDYTLAQAEAAQPQSVLPDYISKFNIFIGKIIVQANASTFTEIVSAFAKVFTYSSATQHSDLSNVMGSSDQYHVASGHVAAFETLTDANNLAHISISGYVDNRIATTTPLTAFQTLSGLYYTTSGSFNTLNTNYNATSGFINSFYQEYTGSSGAINLKAPITSPIFSGTTTHLDVIVSDPQNYKHGSALIWGTSGTPTLITASSATLTVETKTSHSASVKCVGTDTYPTIIYDHTNVSSGYISLWVYVPSGLNDDLWFISYSDAVNNIAAFIINKTTGACTAYGSGATVTGSTIVFDAWHHFCFYIIRNSTVNWWVDQVPQPIFTANDYDLGKFYVRLQSADANTDSFWIDALSSAVSTQTEAFRNLYAGQITAAGFLNSSSGYLLPTFYETWHNVGATNEPAFENSWVNLNLGYQVLRFRKIGSIVYIEGTIASGTVDAAAFTLPVGLRPPLDLWFPCVGGAASFGIVAIQANGLVKPNATNTYVFVNCQFGVN